MITFSLPYLWRFILLILVILIFLILKFILILYLLTLFDLGGFILIEFISIFICLLIICIHILCFLGIRFECIRGSLCQEDLCFQLQAYKQLESQEIVSMCHEVWTQSRGFHFGLLSPIFFQHTSTFQHRIICREEDLKVDLKDRKEW